MWRSAAQAGALGIGIPLFFARRRGWLPARPKLNTHWIMYLGLFFGLGAAIKGIMRVVAAYKREIKKADKKAGGQNGGGGAGTN